MRGGGHSDSETADSGSGATETTLDADEFYRLLSSSPRRRVLYFLREHSTADLEELSDVLAGWRAVKDGRVVEARERDRLRTTLHHTHLPLFESAGVAVYDHDSREVVFSPSTGTVSTILRHAHGHDATGGRDR